MIAPIPKELLNLGKGGNSQNLGVVVALVTDNKDTEERGRIKIKFPWRGDEAGEAWARLATLMSGNERGTVFYPEVDDEVLVAFEHGNIDSPYIIGALWNGARTSLRKKTAKGKIISR